MYQLKQNKQEGKLEVRKLSSVFKELEKDITEIPKKYNDYYYFCSKRQPLVDLANTLKLQWLEEAETELNRLRVIKVG